MKLEQGWSIALIGILLAVALGACQKRGADTNSTADTQTTSAESGEGPPQAPPPDTYTGALGRQEAGAPATNPPQAAVGMSEEGKRFLTTAAQEGTLEVQAARLAAEKAQSMEVRQFARTMVENHSRVNDSLMQLAQTKGVQIPAALNEEGRELLEKLRGLTGPEFDRTYAEEMLKAHERTVRLFEQAAKSAADEDMKAFAQTQLPTLRDHLRLAHTLPGAQSG